MGAAAAAIIIKRERELIEHFRRAGATSPQTALTPSALGVEQRFAWERLVDGAVIRNATNDTFYLDEPSWEALGRRRRTLAVAITIGMIAVAVVAALSAFLVSSRPRS
jgi:hypothetical protein